jgi:hypothetical protein
MTDKPGPTGEFPKGKLRADDRGELAVAISLRADGTIFMEFGTSVTWLAMSREDAIVLAHLLLEKAGGKSS